MLVALALTHTHVHTHTYTRTRTHAHVHTHTYTRTRTRTHAHAHVHVHTHTHTLAFPSNDLLIGTEISFANIVHAQQKSSTLSQKVSLAPIEIKARLKKIEP